MYVCFAFVGGVRFCFLQGIAALFGWLCVCRNEGELLPFVLSSQTYLIPFPVRFVCWFGWFLPVARCHRHTAQTLFSAVVTCKVYPVHAERRTADPIRHYCTASAEVYYCAGRALNPIGLLCLFSRAAGRNVLLGPCRPSGQASVPLFLLTMQR